MKTVYCFPFFLLAMLLLFTNSTFGQFSIGLKVGVNISKQKFDNEPLPIERAVGVFPRTDLTLGYQVAPRLSVLMDLGYNSQGYSFKNVNYTDNNGAVINENVNSRYGFRYLQTGASLKYNILQGKFNWFVLAGGAFSKLVKGAVHHSQKVSVNGVDSKKNYPLDISGYYKADFELNIGTGIDYKISEKYSIQLATQYQHGLKNINKVDNFPSRVFNRSVGLTGGFFYKFSK